MKRPDKWLQQRFDGFNERFHQNAIPTIEVVFGEPMDGADAHYDPEKKRIIISKTLNGHDTLCLICLHHEMAHAKLDLVDHYVGTNINTKDPDHGMRYQAEIDRLYRIGAYDGLL